MKTAFDTTWYVPETAAARAAGIGADADRILRQLAAGHLYVVEFGSGIVKVGRTAKPEIRLANHSLFAQVHGGRITQSWVSGLHYCSADSERELIDFCLRFGPAVVGREYFRAPFADVRARASLIAANRFATHPGDDMPTPLPPPTPKAPSRRTA